MTDFPSLLRALVDAQVEFIIVGGLAATIHGSSRLTQDIDVVYARSDDNLQRLTRALAPHQPYLRGAPPGLPFEWSAATLKRGLNFALTTSLGDIDVLGEISGGGRRITGLISRKRVPTGSYALKNSGSPVRSLFVSVETGSRMLPGLPSALAL